MGNSNLRPNDSNTLFPSSNSIQRVLKLSADRSPPRKKVQLSPGHSPLDWAHLNQTASKVDMRGVPDLTPPPTYVRVTREQLKVHKLPHDCWTSINGKVFNITPYLDFHPGGVDEIMKCAGKDGTSLFNKYHSWVNVDRMLEKCWIGVLVR